ncbi:MAG TPA: hypothetical protein VL572_13280 [Pyrinomonadaceae bacterium]|nr:hypothetical protein [Pyrinomonadaceae bacterium]
MGDRSSYHAPEEIGRFGTIALGAGGIALLAWGIGAYFNPEQGLRSWLLGFIFWGGISIGSIGLLMLQYLTGGAWGVVIRRILEACSRSLLISAVLFLPLLFFVKYLYEWTHLAPTEHAIAARGWYLTTWGWSLRAVIYFALFGVMAYLLNRWGGEQDKTTNYEDAERFLGRPTAFSGPTIVFYVLTVTLAAVDWVMTLDPHWFSTMWGLMFLIGWALSCLSFVVTILAYLSDKVPMNRVVGRRHFHDLGKLMLAFVMVWAYFNFSQFLIIWSGNIPEETGWYIDRMQLGWGVVGMILVLFHFAAPFLILLRQDLKRRAGMLSVIAVFILLMRLVDMFYLISPSPRISTHGKGLELALSFSWMDIVAPIAVGGIWLWYFFGQLAKRPLVPVMDPFLEKAIHHGQGH